MTPAVRSDQVPLIFSGSPETPARSGLLYRDTVIGSARVVAYHANGLGQRARLVVLARNVGRQRGTLVTSRQGSASTRRPDPVIGQQTLLRYFASRPLPARSLRPGDVTVLYSSAWLSRGAVASVMFDLRSTARTQISVLMLGEGETSARPAQAAWPTLPRDRKHARGTFPGANRTLWVSLPAKTARVTVGGQSDLPLRGTDALTGERQILKGNYGVLYSLQLKGTTARQLALSVRGGAYQGTVQVTDSQRTQHLLLGRGRALKDQTAPVLLWQARTNTLNLQLMPGNGSSLPVTLVLYARNARLLPLRGGRSAPVRPEEQVSP
ncbi:hypothetical protein [Deinococcus apachensis]|uniref:hypothetical protein n=1 Tax=Deinococcus apachensis TaxID=309886 RepID=UPI00039FC9C8|nr:hypothetical protein [Deinococcus apachensis]